MSDISTNHPHAEILDPTEDPTESARSLSILQTAQKERAKRETHLFLDVPSWNGALVAEYRIIDKTILDEMGKRNAARLRAGKFDKVKADIELILRAAVGLWVLDPKSGDRVQLEDEFGHVGYDRITLVLGRNDIDGAQDAVRYVMAERGNDDDSWVENTVAMGLHAQSITRWMKDPSKRSIDLEDLLGES